MTLDLGRSSAGDMFEGARVLSEGLGRQHTALGRLSSLVGLHSYHQADPVTLAELGVLNIADANIATGIDSPTTARIASRSGGMICTASNARVMAAQMLCWLSTSVPSQSNTARRLVMAVRSRVARAAPRASLALASARRCRLFFVLCTCTGTGTGKYICSTI